MSDTTDKPKILTSCYTCDSVKGENFIPDYAFVFQASGTLKIVTGKEEFLFSEGSFRLSIRNRLAKFVKMAPEDGEYRSISVTFDQKFLRDFIGAHGIAVKGANVENPVIALRQSPEYSRYMRSLMPYLPVTEKSDPEILQLKIREAMLTVLRVQPELADILFDFTEPDKVDIVTYMEQNFRFNLKLSRFAYLTGRSLSAFKRDFRAAYNTTPGRWLLEKRLDHSYFLLKEKKYKPSDAYLEAGFEDFSHFSFAFKKKFGFAPSTLSVPDVKNSIFQPSR